MKSLIWKLGLFFLVLLFGAGQLGGCSCSPPTEVTSLVLIDDTHQNIDTSIANYYPALISTLRGMGYGVKFVSEVGLAPSVPTYSIVILADPSQEYTSSETQALVNFVNNGGKLIMMGESTYSTESSNVILNNLSNALGAGITFDTNTIYDDENTYETPGWIETSRFVTHPTTNGLSSLVYFGTCSLSLQGPATPIVYAEDSAHPEVFPREGLNTSKGNSVSIGIEASETKTIIVDGGIILSAVANIGNGKVIAIGDTNIFSDVGDHDYIYVRDNMKFFKNIVNW